MTCKYFNKKCEHAKNCDGRPEHITCPEFTDIEKLVADGHTRHCACRMQWGDGECGCGKAVETAKSQL